jgi:hypothetical protein
VLPHCKRAFGGRLDGRRMSPSRAVHTPVVSELPLALEPVTSDPFVADLPRHAVPPSMDAAGHARQRERVRASVLARPDDDRSAGRARS